MAWAAAWRIAQKYSPQIMLPVAMVVGFIGYKVENYIRSENEPQHKSIAVS